MTSTFREPFQHSKRPRFALDENLHGCYGTKPRSRYVEAKEIVRSGASDELFYLKASSRNLLVITHDIRFVLKILTQKQDIIYENHNGERYFLTGKNSFLIDKNENLSSIKWRNRKEKRIIDFANRTPFYLPPWGFYLVTAL